MANEAKTQAAATGTAGGGDRMAAARAARAGGRRASVNLNPNQKYALRTIQQARSALKRAQDNLVLGMAIPAELIDACGKVNTAVGSMIFD